MTNEQPFTDDDLRVMAFLEALLALSEDAEHAGTVKLYAPTGTFVGDVSLSPREIEVLVESVSSQGNALRLWDPRTSGLPEADGARLDELLAEAETFANEGE